MILETTHINKTDKQIITDLIGRPYSFFQKLKLKGAGSQWMTIEKTHPNLKSYFDPLSDITKGKVQLRPNGVLINMTDGSKTYSWAIPYYQLVVYKTNSISIHAQGRFIQFGKNGTFKENKTFFKKLLDLKVKYSLGYDQFTNF